MVTPTRVLPCPPETETSNRVLRQFHQHLDRFTRVQFTDENGQKFYMGDCIKKTHENDPNVGPLARFKSALRNGVMVCGRLYSFLGYSDGMAREGQAWFFAESEDLTVNAIRQWMGDFSKEKIIAKHAARIGLCFSSTKLVGDVEIEVIDDIKHGKYVYTDGIGLISEELAKRCAEIMGMPDTVPSAVQVRFAGFKGMLTVSSSITGNKVLARPSMRKFEATHVSMGLCTVSSYSRGFLSRQSVLLLEALGVHRSNFRALFDEQMERAKSLTSNDPRYSHEAFKKLGSRRAKKMTTFPISLLMDHGFQHETLLVNVLQVLGCRLLHDLKYRARLEVKDAAYLLGIADETGTLAEGEIYCAIQDPDGESKERHVVTGPCTIFRSPALHPGDVRRVSAVDVPELAHLVNVIVFSTREGSRDLPSMLGGGDLDGDTFTLIWDQRFVVPEGRNYKAMDYSAPSSEKVSNVTIEQVQDFFIDYMKYDELGRISTAHMAAADMEGPTCARAVELAHLASRAADFAKTGVPATCPEWMENQLYPDFMERSPKVSYASSKILGELYRLIDPAPVLDPLTTMHSDPRFSSLPRPRDTYFRQAGALKRQYDIELGGIMRRYGMTEAEIVGGMGVVPAEKRKRREKDDNMRGPVKEAFDELVRTFQQEAWRWCDDHPIPLQDPRESFAIAAYLCTNEERHRKQYVEHSFEDDQVSVSSFGGGDDYAIEQGEIIETQLLSFPYLFVRELIEAVKGIPI
ncbi:hypothetical protein FRC02_010889 [Tulasnella sp. 418]|nr:hypothetical protein FRC02_010889 [Tulasnella sp. 418]